MTTDYKIKSSILCPDCRSSMKYRKGHTIHCRKCSYVKGGFDHLHFIINRIVIGNSSVPLDTQVINLCGINKIITVAHDFKYSQDIHIPNVRYDLHDNTNNAWEMFEGAVIEVQHSLRQNNRILVHCMGGARRSVAVVAWYLSEGNKKDFWRIIKRFKKVRAAVELEDGIYDFLEQENRWR